MRHLSCHVCGASAPASWDDVCLIEGRRVVACGDCGAHRHWHLWLSPRTAPSPAHHEAADG